jgi:hypothetical protein
MVVSRRRIAAVLSGCLLISGAVASGAIGAGLASAAPDATACINALRADRDAWLRVSNEQIDNFNLTTANSALVRADNNYIKYLKLQRDDYFKAYQFAFKGQKSTANTWIKKGNDTVALQNSAIKAYNAEIAKINAGVTKINADFDALDAQENATDQTCAGF